MTADSLIDPESAEKIGQVVAVATGDVYRRDWQRWADAVGDHNPLWFDPDVRPAAGLPRHRRARRCTCSTPSSGVAALVDLRPDGSSGR